MAALPGCGGKPEPKPDVPAEITIVQPRPVMTREYVEVIGRTGAVDDVAVKPRVSGHLMTVYFNPGSIVAKDELLFLIDPSLYRAEVNRAEAQLESALASYEDKKLQVKRLAKLKEDKSAKIKLVSEQEY